MRFAWVQALLLGATVFAAAPSQDANAVLQDLQRQVEKKLKENDAVAGAARSGCTLANAAVRKDW